MPPEIQARLERACLSLEGLSVGDAFGERFFPYGYGDRTLINEAVVAEAIEERWLPSPPWPYTDDTQMALSIVSVLRQYGEINQDILGFGFASRFDVERGYGPGMHRLLPALYGGPSWRELAPRLFYGEGSYGNGGAMRVAPVGAYFAEDLEAVVKQAARSAEVTHAHPEAIAGAIAVAVGAACAWQWRGSQPVPTRQEFIEAVLPHVPPSEVRDRIAVARDLPGSVLLAVEALGSGDLVTALDTVPFVLWCAGQRLDSYEEALWLTVSGLGDRDTTCAMVGGIVSLYVGWEGIPPHWRTARERLPRWPFEERSEL